MIASLATQKEEEEDDEEEEIEEEPGSNLYHFRILILCR
jgi:hypothetical protein